MTWYMLDTNIASYLIKGTFGALREHLTGVPMDRVCVSAVTEGELRYGVARQPESKRLKGVVDEFLLRVEILPWDSKAATRYGALRAALESAGKPMGNLDVMIAAHALAVGAVLVTHDRAFARIEKLKTVDWTRP